jgi:hypothetical protein
MADLLGFFWFRPDAEDPVSGCPFPDSLCVTPSVAVKIAIAVPTGRTDPDRCKVPREKRNKRKKKKRYGRWGGFAVLSLYTW